MNAAKKTSGLRAGAAAFAFALALAASLLSPAGLRAAADPPLPKELPPFGADRPLPVPPITHFTTPEGLTVWIVPRPGFPKLTAILVVRGGGAADPKELPGLSELLVETVKDGTATRTAKQLAEELQAAGGQISADATEDALFVTVNGLSSGAERILRILADVARHASFPAGEVKLAQSNALQGLQARLSTPEFLGAKAFARALYGDHPYHVVAPTPESIAATTPAILEREFARRFRPERALLVVVGDVAAAAVSKTIAAGFGGWKGVGEAAPATPPAPASVAHAIYLVDRPNSVQSLLLVGAPAPRMSDPDYYPIVVANTVLGGSFVSRLTKNIREDKGYSYSPASGVTPRQAGGRLRVRADVRNDVTAPALNEIFYELDRMGTTQPTAEELATAKRFQSGLYLLRNQLQGAIANVLAANWVNGLPPEELSEFVPKINAVAAADVERVGKGYLASRKQLVVVVGDGAKVKPDLEQFGPVTDLKP
ncbi:MAG TPA: pitrilysin family protein [Thermoanaerobaculia bacterium]|nr:pitrilysin family protein [Thermoanaerobaculia bacterium]